MYVHTRTIMGALRMKADVVNGRLAKNHETFFQWEDDNNEPCYEPALEPLSLDVCLMWAFGSAETVEHFR